MCKCTPIIKTPFCGKENCHWPKSMENKYCTKCWDGGHDGGYCCIDDCPCHSPKEEWEETFWKVHGEIILKLFKNLVIYKDLPPTSNVPFEAGMDYYDNLKSFIKQVAEEAERRGVIKGLSQNGQITHSPPITSAEELAEAKKQGAMEVINELGSNPNSDGSVSPNIMHWIEQKQIQLRKKFGGGE